MTAQAFLLAVACSGIAAFALYCVLRLAITHALRDARHERMREEARLARDLKAVGTTDHEPGSDRPGAGR